MGHATARTLDSGPPVRLPESAFPETTAVSGPLKLRLAIATLAGLAAALLTAGSPVATFASALVLGSSLLLAGLAALTAGAVRHRRALRATHRPHLSSGRLAESQGAAFLLWFAGHAAVWAGVLVQGAAAALRFFGPGGPVLVGMSGCAAAAAFFLAGLVGGGPRSMLGLCWERRGETPPASMLSLADVAVVLRSRFLDACEGDAAAARNSRRMSTFTRIQIALDLARSGRSCPRLRLQGNLLASALHETSSRARALVPAAALAMLVTSLLVVFGLLGVSPVFDPRSWPSIAALSATAPPNPGDEGGAAPTAADPTASGDDEASLEPIDDALLQDRPTSDAGEKGDPETGESEASEPRAGGEGDEPSPAGGSESRTGAGEPSAADNGMPAFGSDSPSSDPRAGDSGGSGASSTGGPSSGHQYPAAPGGASPSAAPSNAGKTGDDETGAGEMGAGEMGAGEMGAGETGAGETGAGETGAGETGDDGETGDGGTGAGGGEGAESPGDTPSPGEGAGGGETRPPSDERAAGAGSGRGQTGAKPVWGLGEGAPRGEISPLEPPAASDVVTLRLPVLGSATVRLEGDGAAGDGADAPRGPAGRPPGEPLEERAEPEPSPPQQPLPAWIVRLLRGRG